MPKQTRPKILYMCPYCGEISGRLKFSLIRIHHFPLLSGEKCPGSEQIPRNPESDRRPLWKDLPE